MLRADAAKIWRFRFGLSIHLRSADHEEPVWDELSFAARRLNSQNADFSDLRCTQTNVRFGEPFNKRSFLGGSCKRS
jgi:hypothetical protein